MQLDGEGQTAYDGVGAGGYLIRSSVFGGQIVTYVNAQGQKIKGRVLDGNELIAEQIGGAVKWHHRDPLNQVSRDTEAGQVKGTMVGITPLGVQMPSTEGVNLSTYYACLYAPNSPNCGGQIPQPPGGYGPDKDKEHGQLAAGLIIDGARTLSLWSPDEIAQQYGRSGGARSFSSTALAGTPLGGGTVVSHWVDGNYLDEPDADPFTSRTDYVEGHFEFRFVPGGSSVGTSPEPCCGVTPITISPIDTYYDYWNAANKEKITTEINRIAGSKACNDAFKAAGLKSPGEILKTTGVEIAPRDMMFRESGQKLLAERHGVSIKEIQDSVSNLKAGAAATSWPVSSKIRRPVIFYSGNAFNPSRYDFNEITPHEVTHIAGVGRKLGWLGIFSHDLAGYEHYDSIIKACKP